MRLAEVLRQKGPNAITLTESATVADAVRAMQHHHIGSVVITTDDQQLLGIFTERDVVRLCAEAKGSELATLLLTNCMTRDVMTATPDNTVDEVLSLMTTHRFRRIPVLIDGKIAGLLSIGDLVKAKLNATAEEAAALRHYITS